jgi:hypothetical protein
MGGLLGFFLFFSFFFFLFPLFFLFSLPLPLFLPFYLRVGPGGPPRWPYYRGQFLE